MMRLLIPLLLSTGVAAAQPLADLGEWNLAWTVANEEGPAGFVRLDLTPVILDASQPSLNDLRLAYSELAEDERAQSPHKLVPFILHRPPVGEQEVASWKPVQVLDRSYVPNAYEQLVLDYGEPVQKNRLRIDLSGTNYRRRVTIEGSDDGRDWRVLKEDAWLFAISQASGNYEADIVEIPLNRFRYLRVTAHHMADDPRRIDIRNIETLHTELHPMTLDPVELRRWEPVLDEKTNITELMIDVGFRNMPLAELELDVLMPLFYRAYELAGRNGDRESVPRRTETGWDEVDRESDWNVVRRGVIYRIDEAGRREERVVVKHLAAPYRYLRLRIIHEDNRPLDVQRVIVRRRPLPSLVFDNDPAQPISLYTGNPRAQAPAFDLKHALRDVREHDLPAVAVNAAPSVRAEGPRPGAWQGILTWAALLIAAAVMGWLILANLRKLRPADE